MAYIIILSLSIIKSSCDCTYSNCLFCDSICTCQKCEFPYVLFHKSPNKLPMCYNNNCQTTRDFYGCTSCRNIPDSKMYKWIRPINDPEYLGVECRYAVNCNIVEDMLGCYDCPENFFLLRIFFGEQICIENTENEFNCKRFKDNEGCTECWDGGVLIDYKYKNIPIKKCSGGKKPINPPKEETDYSTLIFIIIAIFTSILIGIIIFIYFKKNKKTNIHNINENNENLILEN